MYFPAFRQAKFYQQPLELMLQMLEYKPVPEYKLPAYTCLYSGKYKRVPEYKREQTFILRQFILQHPNGV